MFGRKKVYFDLQVHTARYSPCSTVDPARLIDAAVRRGLDGLVLTEHDRCWSPAEIAELKLVSQYPDFILLGGCEVRTTHDENATGDLLVLGLAAPPREPCTIDQVCRDAHRQGGLVIAPHPFAGRQGIRDEVFTSAIDAIEVYNHRYWIADPSGLAARAWHKTGLTGVAGSDAHALDEVGACCTEFEGAITNMAELIEAISQGHCRPRRQAPPAGFWRRLSR